MVSGFRLSLLALITLLAAAIPVIGFEGMHGHGPTGPKVNYDSLYDEATPLEASPEGQRLVRECIEAYGGAEHLAALKSLNLYYSMTSFLSPQPAEVSKNLAPGRCHRMVRHGGESEKQRIIRGDHAWRVTSGDVTELVGSDYCGQLFSYLTLRLPLSMESDEFNEAKFGHRKDDSLGYIYLMKPDSLLMVVGINPKTLMIESSEGITRDTVGDRVYINRFSDYRKVDNYVLAHRVINVSLGLEVGQSTLIGADVNPVLANDLFTPGGGNDTDR